MDKKREQDFADLEVKRLCGVFGTPIPALSPWSVTRRWTR